VDATKSQRKRTTEKHLEKRSGEGDVDSGLQFSWRKMEIRQYKTELSGDESLYYGITDLGLGKICVSV